MTSFTEEDHKNPVNVGILAMEVYFPSTYVSQASLEKFDGVDIGKYTIGLGQTSMAFTGDREDICSMCLTVVRSLMEKYSIPYESIGRLEVGTESLIDKSKSVKTVLMQLFQQHGNTRIEGVDVINACYGGTAALFNAIDWLEGHCADQRLALVVAGDIAVYERGPARATGGAGALALLLGPHAPLVIEPALRAVHMEHVYDFYKPSFNSEYPYVDGKLSVECYLRATDACYRRYKEIYKTKKKETFNMNRADFVLFHAPFCKLVQKAFARLAYNEFLDGNEDFSNESVQRFSRIPLEDSYNNRELEQAFIELSKDPFSKKTLNSLLLARELGNLYCGSLYSCLLSLLVTESVENLLGKRILMFSYGSGLASAMFSILIVDPSFSNIVLKANIKRRLKSRIEVSPSEYTLALAKREKQCNSKPYLPSDSVETLFVGSYFLTEIDDKFRRSYAYKGRDVALEEEAAAAAEGIDRTSSVKSFSVS